MSSNIGFGRVRKKFEGPYVTKLNGPHVTIGSEKTGWWGHAGIFETARSRLQRVAADGPEGPEGLVKRFRL